MPKLRESRHPVGLNCHEISPCHDLSSSVAKGVVGAGIRGRLLGLDFLEIMEESIGEKEIETSVELAGVGWWCR